MVDISMCTGRGCNDKNTCFRYLAFPDEYQSYIMIDTRDMDREKCEMYWRCRNAKELAMMNRLNK